MNAKCEHGYGFFCGECGYVNVEADAQKIARLEAALESAKVSLAECTRERDEARRMVKFTITDHLDYVWLNNALKRWNMR